MVWPAQFWTCLVKLRGKYHVYGKHHGKSCGGTYLLILLILMIFLPGLKGHFLHIWCSYLFFLFFIHCLFPDQVDLAEILGGSLIHQYPQKFSPSFVYSMKVKLNQFGYVFSMILKVLSHNLSSDVESIFPFTTNVFNHIFSCSYSCLDIFLALSAIDGWGLDLFE